MASRRKKKRNRQLQDLGQNGPIPRKDRNVDAKGLDRYNDSTAYDDADYDEDDYDESVYGDVDRDYRDDDTDTQASDASLAEDPAEKVYQQPNTVSTTTDSSPPPLPKHESNQEELSGPHIKFPPNAKRKAFTSGEVVAGKQDQGTSEADEPKKPNRSKWWWKKDKEADDDASSSDVAKPKHPVKEKASTKAPLRERVKNAVKSKKSLDSQIDEELETVAPRRRWRVRAFWAFFAFVVLVWALPLIITKTPLLNLVLAQATADLDGTAQVKSVSCGWFSGISVEGVNVKDRQGNTVIEVPAVEGERTLLGLLWNSSNLGHFRIDKPVVHVVLGPDGSTNIEELIAGYLEGPSGDPMDLGIEVVDAKVILSAVDPTSPKDKKKPRPLLTLSGVDASVEMLADPNAAVSTSVKVAGTVDEGTSRVRPDAPKQPKQATKPGRFAAELGLGHQNKLTVDAKQIFFDRFGPLLARVTSGLELQGSMTGQLDCRWLADSTLAAGSTKADSALAAGKSKGDDMLIKATAQLDGFSATGGPLGTDRLALAQPKLDCELASNDGVYVLRQANLDSEVATLSLDGQVVLDVSGSSGTVKNAVESPAAKKNTGTSPAANKSTNKKAATNQTFNLTGRVNLVRLAEMLPTTLHLHDQTKVSAGELTLNISAVEGKDLAPLASGATPLVWNANLQTTDLTAMRHGRELQWHQPITVTLHAHEAGQGSAVVDHLLCTSNFLRIEAAGDAQDCSAAASFDLNKLMNQLGAFVDLGGLQMRGQGWANLNWRRVADQKTPLAQGSKPNAKEGFVLDGDCQLRDLEISVAQPNIGDLVPVGNPTYGSSNSLFKQPWRESRVVMILSATGRMPADGPISLASGEVRINSGQGQVPGQFNEQIVAHLTGPIKEVSAKTVWPVAVSAQGQLGLWAERAHAIGIASDWFAQGVYNAQLGGNYQADSVKFDSVSVKVNQFQVAGPSVHFNEPLIDLTMAGHYDTPRSRLLVNQAKCQTSAAILTAKDLIVGTPTGKPLELAGTLGVEGDLTRMQGWIADPRQPSNWTYQGNLKGTADLKQIDGIVSGQVKATVQQLQLSDRAGHHFYEPSLVVAADGKYDNASRVVEFTQAQLTSSALSGQVKGKLISGDDPMKSDFAGSMDCNMQRLSELLVPYIGPGVAFQGVSNNKLKLSGPMTLDRLNAQAGIGWDAAQIYGFNLGKGKLDFAMADGLVSSSPIKMDVSGGKVNLAPQLRVAPGAMQLEMQPGTIAENIQINQQMCKGGLKYIAPILADVATADGRFSLAIDQCRLPIDNPGSGELAGRFMVHSMTVGGGPLLQQLAPVLKNAATPAQLQKESVVKFQMVDGRVYHEGLELVFPDITIKTHGYVGLDQSLNIIAEMPVPQKWIDQTGGSIKPALRGQKVMLPIAGSLSKPRLNQQQMQRAMQDFIGTAAANILENEGRSLINQGLNQLLGPR